MVYYLIIATLALCFLLPALASLKRRRRYSVIARADEEDMQLNVVSLAQSMTVRDRTGVGIPYHETVAQIKRAFSVVKRNVKRGVLLEECEKWLYENGNFLLTSLDKKGILHLNALPRCGGKVRAVALAHLLTSLDRCEAKAEKCIKQIKLFNKYAPLTVAEIFALPAAFEYSLLRHISRMCKRIILINKSRRFAASDEKFEAAHSRLPGYGYYCKLLSKLAGEESAETGTENAEITFGVYLSDTALLLSNAVKSLKSLHDEFDLNFMLSASPAGEIFSRDKTYRDMDDISKKLYLNALGALSRFANMSERYCAEKLMAYANEREKHFGEYLFESRRKVYRLLCGKKVSSWGGEPRAAAFGAAVFAIDAALAATAAVFVHGAALAAFTFFAVLFTAFFPVEYLLVKVLSAFMPVRNIPRLKCEHIPDGGKVLTVMSVVLSDARKASAALEELRAIRSVNADDNAGFVLLADFEPSYAEHAEKDGDIIAALSAAEQERDIFVLVRKRVKNGAMWSGRERKRGAIEDMNELLLRGERKAFEYIGRLPFTPVYVLLLDADSRLTPGGVRRAVNAAMHPLAGKYDMLSFGCKYKLSSLKTPYSLRYLRDSGVEEYCSYSDFYYNLSGQSVFCGKGIYNLRSFDAKLRGKLPEGRILSHDIAEGALIKCGAAGDIVYEDAPPTYLSHMRREERWRRGDLLLLPVAFSRNCHALYRYIILRNALAVFSAPLAFAAVVTALAAGNIIFAIITGVCLMAVPLVSAGFSLYSIADGVRARYALGGFLRSILLGIENILLLPFNAFMNIAVTAKTIFRLLAHKNLLEWRTFAGSMKEPVSAHFTVIAGGAVLLAAVSAALYSVLTIPVYAALCVIYACALALGNIGLTYKSLSKKDKAFLRAAACDTYAYFDYMRGQSRLISDNLSFENGVKTAQMTSPTNLGFGILAHVCASECGILPAAEAIDRINADMLKLRTLPKWKGNLYNWYDLDGKPKSPRFVSSVDNGNLAACLTVARAFLKANNSSCVNADILLNEMRLEALFDRAKGRFFIGYDLEKDAFEGHYDMMASESRVLAYIAACRGIPAWDGLRRDIISANGNMLVSWAGTAFEYLMPQLFFEDSEFSLITHSCRGASTVMSANTCKGMFGISESGYYDFDDGGNYRYGQFGISTLALKAANDKCVISPYSSAMMLKYIPARAAANLKKLKKAGVYGKYGFCEAIDCSAGGKIVCSHMSHHQGMIMAAVTNALHGNIICKYFMSDEYMRGGKLLTEERVPLTVCARKPKADFVYPLETGFFRKYAGHTYPKVALLSEGGYSAAFTESGCSLSRAFGMNINRWRQDPELPDGGFFVIKGEGEEFSPTYMPIKAVKDKFTFSYEPGYVEYENLSHSCKQKIFLLKGIEGEVRKLTIKNNTDSLVRYEISYYERLSMAEREEYASHPVYADMFVSCRQEPEAVYATKRSKSESGDKFAAFKLYGGENCKYSCSAASVAGKQGVSPDFGDVMYPCLNVSAEITVTPGGCGELYVIKAFGTEVKKLEEFMRGVDEENYFAYCEECAKLSSLRTLRYRSDNKTNELLDALAPSLLYSIVSAQNIHYYNSDRGRRVFVMDHEKHFALLDSAISAVLYMNLCGLPCELAVILDKNDEYYAQKRDRLLHRTIMGNIEKLNLVHITDICELSARFNSPIVFFADEIKKVHAPEQKEFCEIRSYKKALLTKVEKPAVRLESGFGYFTDNGDYIVTSPPLLPYSNVVAAEEGGFVITQNGGGFTFASNSCENKITLWHNDPVEDTASEKLYLVVGGKYLRCNKLQPGGYVRHAKGATYFCCMAEGVLCNLQVGIVKQGLAKVYRLTLKNTADTVADADIIFNVKPLLGRIPSPENIDVKTISRGVIAENSLTGQKAYIICLQDSRSYCRQSYFRALNGDIFSSDTSDVNVCVARITASRRILSGEEICLDFVITNNERIANTLTAEDIAFETEKQVNMFKSLQNLSISGIPEQESLLMNNLPYQIYSSRLSARCGFYQAGGAVGFRDQLQDCLAHLYADPDYVRSVILECAAHQYEEGDVMHWWHRPNLGVRTRITDDRLFLGYVTTEYIAFTSDGDILNEEIPYLSSPPLADDERARMERAATGGSDTLLRHILRAIDSLKVGEHGLLLIGGGDWNDALDEIGLRGRGESVWLTQFAAAVIDKMLPSIDAALREKYISLRDAFKAAVEGAFFNGRYARAFTDDGIWLGTDNSPACKIDIICQAWSVISGIAGAERAAAALAHANKLIDENFGVVRLLDPPFDKKFYCGYISSYPKGVRENGGQYTHAAVWLFKAYCKTGDGERAARLARILDPIYACEGDGKNVYCGEPYVIAADVYYNEKMKGRMGWSWYTGSAAWYFKTYLEDYLGFRIRRGAIECKKPLIKDWKNIVITYRRGKAVFRIHFAEGERDCVEENGIKMTGVPISIERDEGHYDITFVFAPEK